MHRSALEGLVSATTGVAQDSLHQLCHTFRDIYHTPCYGQCYDVVGLNTDHALPNTLDHRAEHAVTDQFRCQPTAVCVNQA